MVYPAKLSRAGVVAAALALVDQHGRAALGMRAVAEALGVRPASLYRHVGDLAGLEALLAEAAATTLAVGIDDAFTALAPADPTRDPAVALRAMATAYVRFARECPARYALLTTATTPDQPGDARKALWTRLLAAVGALTGDADDTSAAVAAWAFLHGFVALEQAGLYGVSGPEDGLTRGIDALAHGLARPAR